MFRSINPASRYLIAALVLAAFSFPVSAQNHFGAVVYHPVVDSTINGSGVSALKLDSLQKWIKQLSGVLPVTVNGSSVTIPHRYAGSGSIQFRNAAQHIYNVFQRYGLNPVLENNATPYTKINVIGTLPGRRAEYVVICGHFDSANPSCPGADDNASGTAAVLEAARILRGLSFEYTIKFIAFGGEEQGLLGSQQYVQQHVNDSIRAAVNCDMIMWDNNSNRVVQVHAIDNTTSQFSADLADFIAATDTAYAIPLTVSIELPGIGASDHSRFWNINRSAVLVIEEYGVDFNSYYHTANDSWANTSAAKHQNFFRETARLSVASVMHLAKLNAPVPVSLAAFTAHGENNGVRLAWRTEGETNNAGFHVERSTFPPDAYSSVGFVPGHGTRAAGASYEYFDGPLAPGRYAYRLSQIDHDGTRTFSQLVVAEAGIGRGDALMLALYPNPARGAATITFALRSDEHVTLAIHDALGRRVAMVHEASYGAGVHQTRADLTAIPAGAYLLVLETPSGRGVMRVTVGG